MVSGIDFVCVGVLASDWADGEDGVHFGDKGGVTSVSSLAFVFVCVIWHSGHI